MAVVPDKNRAGRPSPRRCPGWSVEGQSGRVILRCPMASVKRRGTISQQSVFRVHTCGKAKPFAAAGTSARPRPADSPFKAKFAGVRKDERCTAV